MHSTERTRSEEQRVIKWMVRVVTCGKEYYANQRNTDRNK